MKTALLITTLILAIPAPIVALAAGTETQPAAVARDPDYEAGKKAIEAKNWTLAIESLNRAVARDSANADIHNWLGYAYRKSGNLDAAFRSYNEALRLDPKHKGAHEYVGEAYLMVNNLAKAEEHLAQLDKICFFPCEEFRELKKAVDEYKQRPAK
jgi:Flp pilus assembly protein TadD